MYITYSAVHLHSIPHPPRSLPYKTNACRTVLVNYADNNNNNNKELRHNRATVKSSFFVSLSLFFLWLFMIFFSLRCTRTWGYNQVMTKQDMQNTWLSPLLDFLITLSQTKKKKSQKKKKSLAWLGCWSDDESLAVAPESVADSYAQKPRKKEREGK